MSDRTFTAACVAAAIAISPAIALGWVFIVATVNFHDVLEVTCAFAVLYHLHAARRENRAADRALRHLTRTTRLAERRAARDTFDSVPLPRDDDRAA